MLLANVSRAEWPRQGPGSSPSWVSGCFCPCASSPAGHCAEIIAQLGKPARHAQRCSAVVAAPSRLLLAPCDLLRPANFCELTSSAPRNLEFSLAASGAVSFERSILH